MRLLLEAWALPSAMAFAVYLIVTWYGEVMREVPNPYLDEYFHVPQAQKYCRGDYSWDPKITTPPGLYLVSKLFKPLLGCEISSLRIINVQALCAILTLSYGILRILRKRDHPNKSLHEHGEKTRPIHPTEDPTHVVDVHSALNIALFPPLFFFSVLYYTDVWSTIAVLLAYCAYLANQDSTATVTEYIGTVVFGVIALLFRQTNIFWVAVFPAGLAVVNALKKDSPSTVSGRENPMSAIRATWNDGIVRDCSLQDAELQDVAVFMISLIIAALQKPLLMVKVVFPYITLLVLFASFVAWNGSVVLGDKSAHTATIHLPQMLYIWPYIAFFSAPLLIRPLFRPLAPLLSMRLQTACHDHLNASNLGLPTLLTTGLFVACSFLAVHFNTIIHPYTLADNRHYIFYVFKMLRLYPALKYLTIPVYYVSAWLTIQALASPPTIASPEEERTAEQKIKASRPKDTADRQPCQISFVVIWLATTALSVVTAPLVEPRYFIIPWIIWRLHVPCGQKRMSKDRYDMGMVFETLWLLGINAAVSYTFLYRTFAWSSEPDNLQRFIW